MTGGAPLATVEVRWFFAREDTRFDAVRRWFLSSVTGAARSPQDPSIWDERTDVYLLLPGADDMGVKWRDGQLQLKGRTASLGAQPLGNRHHGVVERWIKWSYPELPAAYQQLFADGGHPGLTTVPVRKRRALRRLRLDTHTGAALDVRADEYPERGLGVEFTELVLRGRAYGTLGFEAHPDDEAMRSAFAPEVARLLLGLDTARLSLAESMSYPAWLAAA